MRGAACWHAQDIVAWIDRVMMVIGVGGFSMPVFWLGFLRFLASTVFSIDLLGNGLRDQLDPQFARRV